MNSKSHGLLAKSRFNLAKPKVAQGSPDSAIHVLKQQVAESDPLGLKAGSVHVANPKLNQRLRRPAFSQWSSCGLQRCERLNELHNVTCIVIRCKGNSDPFTAGRTYDLLISQFLYGFPRGYSIVAE